MSGTAQSRASWRRRAHVRGWRVRERAGVRHRTDRDGIFDQPVPA
jgi:hypothetical protein